MLSHNNLGMTVDNDKLFYETLGSLLMSLGVHMGNDTGGKSQKAEGYLRKFVFECIKLGARKRT
jgi:hypothetical protein